MKDELVRGGQGDSRDLEQHVSKMSIFIRLGTGMNMYKTVYKLSRPLETSFIKQVQGSLVIMTKPLEHVRILKSKT